jgi:5-methylcytosine-specific restriction endonuclease McrA
MYCHECKHFVLLVIRNERAFISCVDDCPDHECWTPTSIFSLHKQKYFREALRAMLLELQDNKCWICERDLRLLKPYRVTIDHLRPLSLGGENHVRNMKLACSTCNNKRMDHRRVLLGNGQWTWVRREPFIPG